MVVRPGQLPAVVDAVAYSKTIAGLESAGRFEEAALAWYNDPDYQQLSEHRRSGTDLNFITLVHGLPPRT